MLLRHLLLIGMCSQMAQADLRLMYAGTDPSDREPREYHLFSAEASTARELTNTGLLAGALHGDFGSLSWSPDGRAALFAAFWFDGALSGSDIFLQRVDWPDPVNLTNSAAVDLYPSWSPDGECIVFCSDLDGQGFRNLDVYTMNLDGSRLINITGTRLLPELFPAWAPGGERIAYVADRGGAGSQVSSVTLRTMKKELVAELPGDSVDISWSPDGSQLAFASVRDGNFDIYLVGLHGGEVTNLTSSRATEFSPAWSPDGAWIAFASDATFDRGESGGLSGVPNHDIFAMRIDGTGLVNLTNEPMADSSVSPLDRR